MNNHNQTAYLVQLQLPVKNHPLDQHHQTQHTNNTTPISSDTSPATTSSTHTNTHIVEHIVHRGLSDHFQPRTINVTTDRSTTDDRQTQREALARLSGYRLASFAHRAALYEGAQAATGRQARPGQRAATALWGLVSACAAAALLRWKLGENGMSRFLGLSLPLLLRLHAVAAM